MNIAIIGAPLDLGSNRRGVDMGPSAIRIARLQERLRELGHEVTDLGNVPAPEAETREARDVRIRFAEEIAEVCEALAVKVREALEAGFFPLVLGGDHSVAMGSVGGAARFY
ncbi:MAG: arginase family protein, partial [Planctomycetes bacterium]|nr:arginase family protein [Planctomycetota bacterium]